MSFWFIHIKRCSTGINERKLNCDWTVIVSCIDRQFESSVEMAVYVTNIENYKIER